MSTGDKRINLYLKKFLPQQQFQENFQFYLQDRVEDFISTMYPESGLFTDITNVIDSTAIDTIDVKTPILGTDALGNLVSLDPTLALNVPFENATGVDYFVGLRFNFLDAANTNSAEINVRTGKLEFTFDQEAVGEVGDPDLVVDNGTTLTLRVNTVTEPSVSNAGRTVRIFLKPRQDGGSLGPLSEAIPFEDVTVVFTGGNNEITTTSLLGQTAGLVSTDTSDYRAYLLGPTIKKNTDLSLDPNVIYLGKVTGVGAGSSPTAFDLTGVNQLFTVGNLDDLLDTTFSFLTGGGLVTWDLDSETLTWASDLTITLPHKVITFTITAAAQVINDGQVAFITRDEIGGVKALTVGAFGTMPNDPIVEPIFIRRGDDIFFRNGALFS